MDDLRAALTEADRALAAISVNDVNVLLMADARRIIKAVGDALGERKEGEEHAAEHPVPKSDEETGADGVWGT